MRTPSAKTCKFYVINIYDINFTNVILGCLHSDLREDHYRQDHHLGHRYHYHNPQRETHHQEQGAHPCQATASELRGQPARERPGHIVFLQHLAR